MLEYDSLEGTIKRLSALLALLTTIGIIIACFYLWIILLALAFKWSTGVALIVFVSGLGAAFIGWYASFFVYEGLKERYIRGIQNLRGGPPWHRNPADPSLFPDGLDDWASQVRTRVEDRFKVEAEALQTLGVPVPETVGSLSFEIATDPGPLRNGQYRFGGMQIRFPEFRLPDSFYFCLVEPDGVDDDRGCGYLTLCDEQSPDTVQVDFETDPVTAVGKHAGCWANRHPYGLYQRLNGYDVQLSFEIRNWSGWGLPKLLSPPDLPALKATTTLNSRELEDVLWRLRFFGAITANTGVVSPGPPAPTWLGRAIFEKVPVPVLTLSEDTVAYKVLPGPTSKLVSCIAFFDSLRSMGQCFSFDLVADGTAVYFRVSVPARDSAFFESQISVHFPDFFVVPSDQLLGTSKLLYKVDVNPTNSYQLLRPNRELSPDPYAGLLKLLDGLSTDDVFCLRFLASPLQDEALQIAFQELERLGSLEKEAEKVLKERVKQLGKKLPAWIASVRVYCTNESLLAEVQRHWLARYETPNQKLDVSSLLQSQVLGGALGESTILNSEELAALAHFPAPEVECERLERTTTKMKAPPQIMIGKGTTIGINEYRGKQTSVVLPDRYRDRHMYVIGKTRTGKSTLMLNMIVQDIQAGRGVGVIDPHGDLMEDILHYVPQSRIQDAIVWDASERSRPIGLNIMEVHTDEEIGILADDLLISFRRLSESWGERMESLLRYIFHALLSCDGTTFFDVQRILLNESFRESIVSQLDNPVLIGFWREQFKLFSKDALQPVLSRMSKFVLSPALSAALGQRESTLNFFDVIQNRKILLVNLAQGKIGEDSAKLLGSLVVSQIQLAAMRRAKVRKEAREPFYLYVDEFQNFTTSAFDKILSEAGKYKLCLTLAHQYVSQLEDKIRNAILGNAGTMMMFPSSAQDARCLKAELGSYQIEDLTDLSAQEHEALCRPPTKSSDTFKLKTLPPPKRPERAFAREVVDTSRSTYGRRAQVTPAKPRPPAEKKPAVSVKAPPVGPAPRPSVDSPERRDPGISTGYTAPMPALIPVSPSALDELAAQFPAAGRGGMRHRKLQHDIRLYGEKHGYRVKVEKEILGGQCSVDVALEKGDLSIACQVCVTNSPDYEVRSIQRCLEAGFSCVVLISESRKTLNKAGELLRNAIDAKNLGRVRFLPLEELYSFFVELQAAAPETTEQTIKGIKVRTTRKTLSPDDERLRADAVYKVISESFRRIARME